MQLPIPSNCPNTNFIFFILSLLIISINLCTKTESISTSCNEGYSFSKMRRNITYCKKLGTLEAEFGWNYHYNGGAAGWVAWGVNPRRPYMVDTKRGCELSSSAIEVIVNDKNLTYCAESGFLTIFAILTLPQEFGSSVKDFMPRMHDDTLKNFYSAETIDLSTFSISISFRNAHGVLSLVGWGTLIPIGTITARYFKEFPVKFWGWYPLHASCQISGYLIGSAGWVIGIYLGSSSRYYDFTTHRDFGIIIFTLTLQVCISFIVRPKRGDEHLRYWHIYHHLLGYTLIVLITINIFKGINILRAEKIWKSTYMSLVSALAFVVISLEVFTWIKFVKFND
ncbi:hypothetical protein MKX01_005479 [Papaver californicum]|nr:hypothetical protein MKX01_005479 [Papaver californicum]